MYKRIFSLIAIAALASTAACSKDEGEAETTQSDTTAVQGTDVVNQPVTVPVTDSVITTTTTTTDTDTTVKEGEATTTGDTTARP